MNLQFTLLVVDDDPDSIGQAISLLEEHLSEKGFSLFRHDESNFSEENLRRLMRLEGRDYDLVIVDYNLGQDAINGAHIAQQLRRGLTYTDMVFYSSNSEADLLGELARNGVSGVFVATRNELDNALIGLADTVVGKAVDLNHMRGIGMAEVAEMDLLMEETLKRVFLSGDETIVPAGGRTITQLRESKQESLNTLNKIYEKGGLSAVVTDSRLCSSFDKFRAIKRIARSLTDRPHEALGVLETYEKEIIQDRNMLAHVKETTALDGATTLQSVGRDGRNITIDDGWMERFRRMLRIHRIALTTVCTALDTQFGIVETD